MDERLHRRRGAGLSFLMGGDGEALVLLHGVPGSSLAWQKVGMRVASRFRVILPDLLGFGASDQPLDDFFLETQAKSVRALLNYLQIKTMILGGHGFGAAVAITLMRLYPELNVSGLILSATNLFTGTKLPFPIGLAQLSLFNRLVAWGVAGNRMGLHMLYESAVENKDDIPWRDFRRHLTGGSVKLTSRIVQRALGNIPESYAEIEATLPHILCPTLLLWGDEDPLCPLTIAEQARVALPDALLKVYAYTGHFVPEERSIECAEDITLRFTGIPLIINS